EPVARGQLVDDRPGRTPSLVVAGDAEETGRDDQRRLPPLVHRTSLPFSRPPGTAAGAPFETGVRFRLPSGKRTPVAVRAGRAPAPGARFGAGSAEVGGAAFLTAGSARGGTPVWGEGIRRCGPPGRRPRRAGRPWADGPACASGPGPGR